MIIPIFKNRGGIRGLNNTSLVALGNGSLTLKSNEVIPVYPNRSGVTGVPLSLLSDLLMGFVTLQNNELIPLFDKNSGVSGVDQDDINVASPLLMLPLEKDLFDLPGGVAVADFNRSSAAWVEDFEGEIHECPDNEARFWRARRVYNQLAVLARNSEDLTVGWTASGATILDFERLLLAPTQQITLFVGNIPSSATAVHFSADLTGSVAGEVVMRFHDGVAISSGTMDVTTTRARYTFKSTISTSSTSLHIQIRSDSGEFDGTLTVQDVQVTYTAVAEPTEEYVSTGVLSAPFHGAGVDGVEYFDTNRAGAALTDLRGLLSESLRTNYFLNPTAPITQAAMVNGGTVVSTVSVTGDITLTVDGTPVTSAANFTYTPAGATSNIQVTGGSSGTVQFEAGAFATTFINNDGTAAVRVAEDTSKTIAATTGDLTLSCSVYHRQTVAGNVAVLYINDGTEDNVVDVSLEDGRLKLDVVDGGVSQVSLTTATMLNLSTINKIAVRISENNFAIALNDVVVGSDLSGTVPVGLTTVDIAHRGGADQLESSIKLVDIKDGAL